MVQLDHNLLLNSRKKSFFCFINDKGLNEVSMDPLLNGAGDLVVA